MVKVGGELGVCRKGCGWGCFGDMQEGALTAGSYPKKSRDNVLRHCTGEQRGASFL